MATPEQPPKKPEIVLGRAEVFHPPSSILHPPSSVLGIGIDIVETERIDHSLEKFGERFLKRVFHPDEVAYAKSMKIPALHLAARFAARKPSRRRSARASGSSLAGRTWRSAARKAVNRTSSCMAEERSLPSKPRR